jgi:hypothetical protein
MSGYRLLHEAEHEVLRADANAVAVDELMRALDELAVHANSVAAIEVLERRFILLKDDSGVPARDERIFDGDFALIATSDVRSSAPEIDLLKVKS